MKTLTTLLITTLLTLSSIAGVNCTATKKDGTPCKGHAQTGATVCYFHNPANQCESKKKDGTKCRAMKAGGTKFCHHHQPVK